TCFDVMSHSGLRRFVRSRTTIMLSKGVMRGRILLKDAGPVRPCRGKLDFRDLTDAPKETTPRSHVPQHRMRTHCDVGGGSLRKTEILFTHAFFRAPARVVAGIDAGRQSSRAGEAGASARSCGYSSRESFSLLSEAAMSCFVGGCQPSSFPCSSSRVRAGGGGSGPGFCSGTDLLSGRGREEAGPRRRALSVGFLDRGRGHRVVRLLGVEH